MPPSFTTRSRHRRISMTYIILMTRFPLRYTLFPYTTLFRSWIMGVVEYRRGNAIHAPLHTTKSLIAVSKYNSCPRSEEHTSELQSRQYLVCSLLLEKKKYARCLD